ncbi:ATP-binding protein [Microseira sp. BLCC-F43]|jgi:signal transduction histidine kinase|uniref:ATP-binding protein n=1 Tax=Microseira sp. BLCC-F43 TaxID=3153602 RepID=UPI0035B794EC
MAVNYKMQKYRADLRYGIGILAITLALVLIWPGLWQNLLAANGFIPHGHCYLWKPGLVWLHVVSDMLIGLSYVAISATLAYLVYKARRDIPFDWVFLAFGTFIVACGATHFMEVWTLWTPTYWLSGEIKLITAVASLTTALILPPLVPQVLELLLTAKVSEERKLKLEDTNTELETLYEKLKEIDELKTQFFANVSHELRTPLALILGPTQKLLAGDALTPEQRQDLEVVESNARILLKQVNDLLDISKLEANKMSMRYAEVDLAQLVRLTAANFNALAQEQNIAFFVQTPQSFPAQVDSEKIQRVLLNLLSNAFKFTPPGGRVRCVVSQVEPAASLEAESSSTTLPASPHPRVRASSSPDSALITVEDSGAGVPLELREVIFERFRQGEESSTRRFGGTGLGLAIVKDFVELHGGTIAVGDAPEGGASFRVELPIVAPKDVAVSTLKVESMGNVEEIVSPMLAQLRQGQSSPVRETTDSGLRNDQRPLVLVVEDNPQMNLFIVEALSNEYRVATAFNGQEGLELATQLLPDLILSDMMMPLMSGEQLLGEIRNRKQLDAIPFVVLTAKADDEKRVKLLQAGAQDYLMKPFSLEELRSRLGNLIAMKRTRDLLQQELDSQSQDLAALAAELALHKRQLNIIAREAQEANRMKDEFLAVLSHELRTPINAILGWAQLLRTRQLNEGTTAKALETIERNARTQTQMIEDLLDVSRIIRGNLQLKIASVNLKSVIDSAIDAVRPAAAAKAIELESCLESSVGAIAGDSDRIQQIIWNLLSNAIKFTPEGGRVEVKLEKLLLERELQISDFRLQISDESPNSNQQSEITNPKSNKSEITNPKSAILYAQIQVSDNGIGINPDFLPYVFDRFRQADSSYTRTHGGLGLGLAIVRHLVELHGGTVSVHSAGEGQGATFIVKLPIVNASKIEVNKLAISN